MLLLTERLHTAGLVLTRGRPSILLRINSYSLSVSLRGCGLVRVSRHGDRTDGLLCLDLDLAEILDVMSGEKNLKKSYIEESGI